MWSNSQFPADLVTFTEEILKRKVHFLCSAHLKINLKQSVELSRDSFLWLSSVSLLLILIWVINILIEKLKPQIGD